ncbi:MAG: helix-turn-helix domain-containing protein [Actinomycetota bacterium]|nr:helix-turn-helix domain-containing protein [Actinomycetota bacterium]
MSTTADVEEAGMRAVAGDRLAVSVEEAARLLGISRDLAYDLIARRELPSVRLGRRIVIPRFQLELLLGAQDAEGGASERELAPSAGPNESPNPAMTSAASRWATSRK